ncbi:hypothetical protein TFLX_00452 [Thermoflexales bacterium]|nr:hypothetical protein TFLX_00452 [Thermoflexales bacterium]
MSRHIPDQIDRPWWRMAVGSLVLMTSAVISVALLIAQQGQAIEMTLRPEPLDEQWTVQSGEVEADRLVLRPAAHSIGLALRPSESTTFTWQTRITFQRPPGTAGLIVQADDTEHFSAFLISSDGYFRVSDYRNGAWIDRTAWRAWPHIRRDGAANVLRAECRSDTCTFFVNDEWTWQEDELTGTPWIGMAADAPLANAPFEVYFDQISRGP